MRFFLIRFQKITKDEAAGLRNKQLIEGRYPNLYLSKSFSVAIGKTGQYTRMSGLNAGYYKNLILAVLNHSPMEKSEIKDLLWDKLPDSLSYDAENNRIDNLLKRLKAENKIENETHGPHSSWYIAGCKPKQRCKCLY